ncbi:MAG: rod shape-determining protein MreC [Patescibacteria group bacterium]
MQRRTLVVLLVGIVLAFLIESVPAVRLRVHGLLSFTTGIETWFASRLVTPGFLMGETDARITNLEQQVDALAVDAARLRQLTEENEALRALTGFSNVAGIRTVTALVIGRDPRDPQTVLRLNAGSKVGVREGAAVVSPHGNLIGIVASVTPTVSTVRLLTSHGLAIPVRVPGKPGVFGLLQSRDGLSLSVEQIARAEPVTVGDVVITNSSALGLPAAIPVGVIAAVRSTPEALWQEATIFPFTTTATVHIVSILVPDETP